MKISKIVRLCMAGLLAYAASHSAQAQSSCKYVNGTQGVNGTMALNIGTLAVPRDAVVGHRLYIQRFQQTGTGAEIECNAAGASAKIDYSVTGLRANTGYNSGPWAGVIYETGVPGIGISWWSGETSVDAVGAVNELSPDRPFCSSSSAAPAGSCRSLPIKEMPNMAVELFKIGPVGTGIINARDLGTIRMVARIGPNKVPMSIVTLALSGSISVVDTTCFTPDVNVAMGKHVVGSLTAFGAVKGAVSPTVPVTIALTNCPGFPGYYTSPVFEDIPAASQSGVVSAGIKRRNTVSIRLDPVDTVIDAANGVLGLTVDAASATGVGLQLLDSAGKPMPLATNVALSNALEAGTRSLNIPLAARYLQTADKVTPGKANAVATYTLIYQ